jgi:hypothetical protein
MATALRLQVVACQSADDQKGQGRGMRVTILTINDRRVTVQQPRANFAISPEINQ